MFALATVATLAAACGAHTATYRVRPTAEPLARKICFEVGGGGNTELGPGQLRCFVLHNLKFDVEFRGNLLVVRTSDEYVLTEVAFHLGRISESEHLDVRLEDLK